MSIHLAFTPRGSFSLPRAAEFLAGFTPMSGTARVSSSRVVVTFRLDGAFEAVGASVTQDRDGVVHATVVGTRDRAAAKAQLARIFSLDLDGDDFARTIADDAPLLRLHRATPGFRPVVFPSPYEAAIWGVLGQRTTMRQAASMQRALLQATGDVVFIDEQLVPVAPHPSRLRSLRAIAGVGAEKLARVHAIAEAALEGRLDAKEIRAREPERAIEALTAIRGVGAWTATMIALRGAGHPDAMGFAEPRVAAGVAEAYGLAALPDRATLESITARWRPYRAWGCVLVVRGIAHSPAWHRAPRRGSRGGAPGIARAMRSTADA